jgi:hypothetical protein
VKPRDTDLNYNAVEKTVLKPAAVKKKLVTTAPKERAYNVLKRETNKDAYKPWTPELDEELKDHYDNGTALGKIAAHFGRTKGAIISRLRKLNHYFEEE